MVVRPNNRVGRAPAARERLASLGLGEGALVFELRGLDDENDRRARELWDPAALERGYDATCARLEASATRLPSLPQQTAMAEAFRLGGEAVRQIVLDPLLPAPIVDTGKRHALVESMRRYDVLGRHYWKGWAGEVVELEQTPGDGSGLAVVSLA
jgi:phenylacetic acid degradation operon negative regulatory protein